MIQSQSLQSAGLPMEKSWLTSRDGRVSDGCMQNEDAGWIPLDDAFPSGDMRPLRFPGCRCALLTRMMKEGRGFLLNQDVFVNAKSITGANEYATNVLGIDKANYKGTDLKIANEWNRGLTGAFERYPKVKSGFSFTGTIQARNKELMDYYLPLEIKDIKRVAPDWYTDADILKLAKKRVRKIVGKAPANSYAASYMHAKEYTGLLVNSKYKSAKMLKHLANDVKTGYHPVGCDTIKSLFDHETAHALDELLGLSTNDKIIQLRRESSKLIESELSKYAKKNRAEFIAEGLAEYMNNPTPRPIAQAIGDIVQEVYDDKYSQ